MMKIGINFAKGVLKEVNDGYLVSDLYLCGMILNLVDGTSCLHAEKDSDNGSRFLFYIKGDKIQIKRCVDMIFAGQETGLGQKFSRFVESINYLKTLLDVAKSRPNG